MAQVVLAYQGPISQCLSAEPADSQESQKQEQLERLHWVIVTAWHAPCGQKLLLANGLISRETYLQSP